MSKRKDLRRVLFNVKRWRRLPSAWELGRIHGLREAARMADVIRVDQLGPSGYQQVRATQMELRAHARKLRRRLEK